MKSWTTTVGPKGQITLPIEVRRALELKPKDPVTVTMVDTEVRVVSPRQRLREVRAKYPPGSLPRPMTWAEVKATVREEMAQNVWDEMHPVDERPDGPPHAR